MSNGIDLITLALARKGGGGGGTSDYTRLSNLPKINGTTITGNLDADALGIANCKYYTLVVDETNRFVNADGTEIAIANVYLDMMQFVTADKSNIAVINVTFADEDEPTGHTATLMKLFYSAIDIDEGGLQFYAKAGNVELTSLVTEDEVTFNMRDVDFVIHGILTMTSDTTATISDLTADYEAITEALDNGSNVKLFVTENTSGFEYECHLHGRTDTYVQFSATSSQKIVNVVINSDDDVVVDIVTIGGTSANIWQGRTAAFYGDSLTEQNVHYTKGYHSWIKDILGLASYENFGKSGYKISDVYTKINSTSTTADLICVMCGVNDSNFSTPLGTFGDTTSSTIYGSLDMLCSLLKSKYPTKRVLFITPHYQTKYPGTLGITSYEISKAIKEVCEKYTIVVYDNFVKSEFFSTNLSTFTKDNCHWNDKGHELVGKDVAQFILDTFRYIEGGTPTPTKFIVTNNLTNCTSTNNATTVSSGSAYNATINADTGYAIESIVCTMGGVSQPVVNNTISISSVTGNIVITAIATESQEIEVNSISLNKNISTLEEGSTETLSVTFDPTNATNKHITWSASNGNATVDASGVVTAVSAGNCVITATTDNGKTASCTYTITADINKEYYGKTFTMTGYKSQPFNATAVVEFDDDFAVGNTFELEIEGTSPNNLKTSSFNLTQAFQSNNSTVSNGSFTGAATNTGKTTSTVDGNTYKTHYTSTVTAHTLQYGKCVAQMYWDDTTAGSASFVITKIKVTANGVPKKVINFGGFFTEETFTLE